MKIIHATFAEGTNTADSGVLNMLGMFSSLRGTMPMHVLGFAICAFLELDDSDKGKSFNFAFQFFDPNGQVILGANDGTLVVPANSLGNETRLAHKLPGLAFTAPGKYMLILTVGQETREFPLTIEEVPNVQ